MKDYNFLINNNSLSSFLNLYNIKIEEIGNGNLNFVYKIYDDKNVFAIKHAKPYLKMLGEDFKLTPKRIIAEMNSLYYFNFLCPNYVPKIYYKDEKNFFFMMDYLDNYKSLREDFTNKKVYKKLGVFLFKTATNKPKENMYFECKELKEITKNYVFEFPFIKNHEALVVLEYFPQKEFSDKFLTNLEKLKNIFLNSKKTLIHGDLHTDSIMVKDENIAIIDSEFSLFCDISFDIGNLLAHTIFSSISNGNSFYKEKISLLFKDLEQLENYKETLQNSIGFCAVEMARRFYVPAKSKDLESIKNLENKKEAYEKSFKIADDLGSNYKKITSVDFLFKRLKNWM